jgi:PRC-barrel domain protein
MSIHPAMGPIGPEAYPPSTSLPALERLPGSRVVDIRGEEIGTVADVYVDDRAPYARYLAVAAADGERWYLLPVDDVIEDAPGAPLVAPYARAQIEGSPAVPAYHDRVDAGAEEEIYAYYGRAGYWEAVRARQETPAPTPQIARAEGDGGEDLAARQTEPAPIPEVAEAEVEDALACGDDPSAVRVKRWDA